MTTEESIQCCLGLAQETAQQERKPNEEYKKPGSPNSINARIRQQWRVAAVGDHPVRQPAD